MEKIVNIMPFTYLSIFNSTTRVMFKLIALANRKSNKYVVKVNEDLSNKIIEECKISLSSYNRAIDLLEHRGFLIRENDKLILNHS